MGHFAYMQTCHVNYIGFITEPFTKKGVEIEKKISKYIRVTIDRVVIN